MDMSRKTYHQARASLLAGDTKHAKLLAEKSRKSARKASELFGASPMRGSLAEQVDLSECMAGLFESPVYAVKLWMNSLKKQDFDLLFYVLDQRFLMDHFFSGREAALSEKERAAVEAAFQGAHKKSLEKYGEFFAAWEVEVKELEHVDNEAVLECCFQLLGKEEKVSFWAYREGLVWRIKDFSVSSDMETRASEILARAGRRVDPDINLVELLRDKGLFETISEVYGEGIQDQEQWRNPLVGHYVRCVEPIELYREGKIVLVPQHTMLKVVQQHKSDKAILFVRTTEVETRDRAIGEVRLEDTDYEGTDETSLWGVDSLGVEEN